MGKLTVSKINSFIKQAKPTRNSDGEGLYFVVPKSGSPHWMLRYTSNKKRREMTLAPYKDLSLADARLEAAQMMKQLRQGLDPLVARKKNSFSNIVTVDDLFADWQKENEKRLKHPQIPARVYRKDISPHIGDYKIHQVRATDIRHIIQYIADSNRPSISNDALMYCKQLFNHGIKLDVVESNPASAFNVTDAGGVEKSRDRVLSIDELKQFFKVAHENNDSFSRDNFIACSLLLTLGVRKSELCKAQWSEFDLDEKTWKLVDERTKTLTATNIPLPDMVVSLLKELQIRACGSKYLLPNRRASKKPHMGDDTLNRAITKLFGHEAGKKKQPPNLMGDMDHFSVHDLRRTFRSLLAKQGVLGHVAERCLNHKLKGVEGIYNRHDYFDERKEALENLSALLAPIIKFPNQ